MKIVDTEELRLREVIYNQLKSSDCPENIIDEIMSNESIEDVVKLTIDWYRLMGNLGYSIYDLKLGKEDF